MIKIKKLLTSLAAIGLIATTASTVVSCAPSLSDVRARTIDTSVYKSTFSNAITNWNIAATMQSADFKVLSNLEDTLMTYSGTKEDAKPQGQILTGEPVTTDNGKSYTLTINQNASWFESSTGKFVRNITSDDIANTARYTLNTNNASEQMSPWTSIVQGANKYSAAISDNKNSGDGNFIINDHSDHSKYVDGETGIEIKDDQSLIIYLNKPSNYFPSMLMTGAFSPTPKEAVKLGYSYGRNGYEGVLLSGPFYVSNIRSNYLMEFKRNPNYRKDDSSYKPGTINTIRYLYSKNSDTASQRQLWETKDITEAIVSPSDTYGSDKYDNFDGIEKVKNNLVGSKYLWFNFAKQGPNGAKPSNDDKRSNMALSLESVRTLIDFGMNRATLLRYFAGPNGNINDFITNTFNPSDYLFTGKDSDKKEYVKDYIETNAKVGSLEARDAYNNNLSLLEDYKDKGVTDLDSLVQYVRDDLHKNGIDGKVTLSFLTSGVNASTFNPYIRQMINQFDGIKDNPLNIIEQPTSNDAEYQQAQNDANFSMFITGETPTYLDPMSYLNDLRIGGTMDHYTGYRRLFSGSDNEYTGQSTYGTSAELGKDAVDITNQLSDADKLVDDETSLPARYTAFAKAESDILFKYKTILPLYTPNGENINYLTYVKANSRTNVGYGYNDYRLDTIKLAKSIQEMIDKNELVVDKNKDNAIVKQN